MSQQNDKPTRPEQIAASIEDVKALLDDNRSLSIAFLSRRIQDIEKNVRERFRTMEHSQAKRYAAFEDAVEKLTSRLDDAGHVCKALQEELDKLKRGPPSSG